MTTTADNGPLCVLSCRQGEEVLTSGAFRQGFSMAQGDTLEPGLYTIIVRTLQAMVACLLRMAFDNEWSGGVNRQDKARDVQSHCLPGGVCDVQVYTYEAGQKVGGLYCYGHSHFSDHGC